MSETSRDPTEAYHRWYYETRVWEKVRWMGVPCLKCVSDMWTYQEVIASLRPSLIVEFGTRYGGAALYFATIGELARPGCRVYTVDTDHTDLHPAVRDHPAIESRLGRSTDADVLHRMRELRALHPGSVFAILDSDHTKQNVLAEMRALRDFLTTGDYLVVEDGNINGHPVRPGWGDGPWEAIEEYLSEFPDDYARDLETEHRFGFTFAPRGFLRRV